MSHSQKKSPTKIVWIDLTVISNIEGYELRCKTRTKSQHPLKVMLEGQEIHGASGICPATLWVGAAKATSDALNSLFQRLISAYENRKVRSEFVWEVVYTVFHRSRTGQQGHRRCVKHPHESATILNTRKPFKANGFVEFTEEARDAAKQLYDFMPESPAENPCLRVAKINRLLMLLLGDLLRLASDLHRFLGRPASEQRNPNSAACSCQSSDYTCPVRPVSPSRFKRTNHYRHAPSVLKKIVP